MTRRNSRVVQLVALATAVLLCIGAFVVVAGPAQATPFGSIGDLVWYDVDGDGIKDAIEPGLAGVDLVLTEAGIDTLYGTGDDVPIDTEVSSASGAYSFTGLNRGSSVVTYDGNFADVLRQFGVNVL